MISGRRRLAWFVAVALTLAAVSAIAPMPDRVTDRDTYEATASNLVVPDCSDLQCFRVLVPWVLGRIPGPSVVKWKLYAAAANAGGSLAIFDLCLLFGLSRRGAILAAVASATGFGSLYTLYDPYTADPLMYCLGPLMLRGLLNDRIAVAGVIGAVGVLAKEFAAAPLYIFTAVAAIRGDRSRALRSLLAANSAFAVWLVLQLTLMLAFNYSYAGSASTDLLGGGNLKPWLGRLSLRGAASAMLNEYTAFYLLAPFGFWFADRRLKLLTLASLPVAALFAYVQQPDRALWNFHFLVVPLGAALLDRVAPLLAWTTIILFAVTNLKVGAQWTFAPPARLTLPLTMLAAAACVGAALFSRSPRAGKA